MNVHDNLLIEFKVKKNSTLQETDVWTSRDQSLDCFPGKKFFVLLEGDENSHISGDARRAGASALYADHVAALAIFSTKHYEKIMGMLFLRINKPITPTRFFDNRDEALFWLQQQAETQA